ncbi:MerR family transcriptional regulator [Desulfitobacterium sp.]|uniref:MerR family transcriptional regulator n=1 Tax=Desulfitobacterium sp. TaxID=49981 RepID=UPI002B21294D|nr:TipAS antibiotic-recognition domain-containing protein [Desulfitobacterium sp.]MEA4901905.1 TipAS antibiotic-recognition domain-containing protein [Desulfitobacterium sp.]
MQQIASLRNLGFSLDDISNILYKKGLSLFDVVQIRLEKIKKQGKFLGPEKIKAVESEWPQLIARVRAEMEKVTPPTSDEVQTLTKRWEELIHYKGHAVIKTEDHTSFRGMVYFLLFNEVGCGICPHQELPGDDYYIPTRAMMLIKNKSSILTFLHTLIALPHKI